MPVPSSRSAIRILMNCLVLSMLLPAGARAQAARTTPAPASEALFRRMLLERPDYASSPGKENTLIIQEFKVEKPVRWTMEYGDNPAQDKNTMVYKVQARYTVRSRNFNTGTGQTYPPSSRDYCRRFNYFVDRSGRWVAQMTGTTAACH